MVFKDFQCQLATSNSISLVKVYYLTSTFEEMSSFEEKALSVLETFVSCESAKDVNI